MKITDQSLKRLPLEARKKQNVNALFFKYLSTKPSGKVDESFRNLHEEVFSGINCLDCGNCCKTLGPRLTDADIRRISASLKVKSSDLISNYLHLDEDNDYVFRQMPCPFLETDNFCRIYKNRPRACSEYPHTNRNRIQQILGITIKNSEICPAVFEIIERMKKAWSY